APERRHIGAGPRTPFGRRVRTQPERSFPVLRPLLRTNDSLVPLILRLTLAVVMFPHGAQKLLGWFGGGGFSGTVQFFTETMQVPLFLALLVIIAEFFGSLAILVGIVTRVAAFGIFCVMV